MVRWVNYGEGLKRVLHNLFDMIISPCFPCRDGLEIFFF